MAHTYNFHGIENDPFEFNSTPMREIKLKEATEDEMKEYYRFNSELKQKFEGNRPSFYMKHGTFNCNPLLADYKYFLLKEGIDYICIEYK